jgi:hypothetical protein
VLSSFKILSSGLRSPLSRGRQQGIKNFAYFAHFAFQIFLPLFNNNAALLLQNTCKSLKTGLYKPHHPHIDKRYRMGFNEKPGPKAVPEAEEI